MQTFRPYATAQHFSDKAQAFKLFNNSTSAASFTSRNVESLRTGNPPGSMATLTDDVVLRESSALSLAAFTGGNAIFVQVSCKVLQVALQSR